MFTSFIIVKLLASVVALATMAGVSRRPPVNTLPRSARTPVAHVARAVDGRLPPRQRIVSNRTNRPPPPFSSALPAPAGHYDEAVPPSTPEARVQANPEIHGFEPEPSPVIDQQLESCRQRAIKEKSRKEQKKYKDSMPPLTQQQRDIAYGMVLGDAHLRPMGWEANLSIEHGSGQAIFVDHLFDVFKLYTFADAPQMRGKWRGDRYDPEAAKRFDTFTHRVFSEIHEAFYRQEGVTKGGNPRHVKHIPMGIDRWLTPRVLAYHIMSDGSNTNDHALNLNTHGFTKQEVEGYRDALQSRFALTTTIQRRFAGTKIYYFIYVPKGQMPRLKEVVLGHMRPYFLYKLSIEHPANIGRVRAHKR